MTDGLRLPLTASLPPTGLAGALPPATSAQRGTSFREVLEDAATDIARREAVLDRALSRRAAPLGPDQLLALQATVQRHSQEVELAAKLVDKLTGSVRQVLTSQQ